MSYTRPALKNLPPALAALPARHQRIAMALGAVVLALAAYNLWFALGAHPLYSPDEGRYARVSQLMAESGDYLVPMYQGQPRLQKPPLIHWLGIVSMSLFGQTEWAVRLPSVLATMLAAGSVYWFGKKVRDSYTGLIAATLLLISPLTVIIGRMVLIDPLLNGFWTAAMVCGYFAFAGRDTDRKSKTESRKYLLLFYLWVALAVFAKGPQGLMPMGIVLVWLTIQRRWRDVLHWQWLVGLVVVSLPIIGWAVAVWASHPDAIAIWNKEIVARATGEGGDHPRPWWYYLPIVIGGFFPLTVMLPLPRMHTPWQRVKQNFRTGHVVGYLIVAMAVPLVIYSAMVGKLVTYIVPMGPPMALVAAWYVRNWLDVTDDRSTIARTPNHPARRIPEGLLTITITLFVILIGATAAMTIPKFKAMLPLDADVLPGLLRVVLQAMIVPVGLVAAMVLFFRGRTRVWGLILAGGCLAMAINMAMNVESSLMSRGAAPQLLVKLHEDLGGRPAYINTVGFRDTSLGFYADRDVTTLGAVESLLNRDPAALAELPAPEQAQGKAWVIIAEPKFWQRVQEKAPAFAARFEQIERWPRPIGSWLILQAK